MIKLINKIKNHEMWKICCGIWFDERVHDFCPKCLKK